MSKDPAFLFYPKDFLEGTSEMTYEEMGIYIKLLSHQWLRGDLPSSKERLSRLLKIPLKDLDGYPYVFEKFDISGESMLNERLESERGRRQKFKESASLAGVKGQFLKKQKAVLKVSQYKKLEELVNALNLRDIGDKGTLKGMLKGCLSNIANVTVTVNTTGGIGESEGNFDDFWNHYHKVTSLPKTDREAAKKYWDKLSQEEMTSAKEKVKAYFDDLGDKKFCRKARTYLENKNFNDEFKHSPAPNSTKIFDYDSYNKPNWKPPQQ